MAAIKKQYSVIWELKANLLDAQKAGTEIKKLTQNWSEAEKQVLKSSARMTVATREFSAMQGRKKIEGVENVFSLYDKNNKKVAEFSKLLALEGKAFRDVEASTLKGIKAKSAWQDVSLKVNKDGQLTIGTLDKQEKSMAALAARAVATIPIWMALRAAYSLVFNAVGEGIQRMVDLDTATRRTLVVTNQSQQNYKLISEIQNQLNKTSLELGISVKDAGDSLLIFAGAGYDTRTSLEAMEISAKLAKAGFADLKGTTSVLTDVLTNFRSEFAGIGTDAEILKTIAAEIQAITKPNRLEMNDLVGSLENSISAAKAAKIQFTELLAILGTLANTGIRGPEAGTAVTSLLNFIQDSEKLQKLQNALNVELPVGNFEKLLLVFNNLERISKDQAIGGLIVDVFGKKGANAIALLSTEFSKFNLNLELSKKKLSEGAAGFEEVEKDAKALADSLASLQEKNKQLQAQMGRAFIQGVLGADDFSDSLKTVNDELEQSIKLLRVLGTVLTLGTGPASRWLGNQVGLADKSEKQQWMTTEEMASRIALGRAAREERLKREAAAKLTAGLSLSEGYSSLTSSNLSDLLGPKPASMLRSKLFAASQKSAQQPIFRASDEDNKKAEFLDSQLKSLQQQGILDEKSETKRRTFNDLVRKSVESFNSLDRAAGSTLGKLDEQIVKEAIINGSYKDLEKITLGQKLNQAEYNKLKEVFIDLLNTELKEQKAIGEAWSSYNLKRIDGLSKVGLSENQIHALKMKFLEDEKAGDLALTQERIRHLEAIQSKIDEIAGSIRSNFQSAFEDLLSNKSTPGAFISRLGDSFRQQSIKTSSSILTKAVLGNGIAEQFASALGAAENNPIVNSFVTGAQRAAPILANAIANPGSVASASSVGGGGLGAIAGIFGGFGNSRGINRASMSRGFTPLDRNGNPRQDMGMGAMNALGAGLITGIGAYQTGGLGGAITGGLGSALTSFAPFMGAMGPAGLALGLGLTVASMFMGGGKKVTEQTSEQTLKIASKIDVTNKQLQIVNRNLVAIKSAIETYVLPSSAYFSESKNISDQFSVFSRRGLVI